MLLRPKPVGAVEADSHGGTVGWWWQWGWQWRRRRRRRKRTWRRGIRSHHEAHGEHEARTEAPPHVRSAGDGLGRQRWVRGLHDTNLRPRHWRRLKLGAGLGCGVGAGFGC